MFHVIGDPYSESWQGKWEYLYSLGRDQPNSGAFRFVPKTAGKPFSDWEVGCLRISPSTHPDGTWYGKRLDTLTFKLITKIAYSIFCSTTYQWWKKYPIVLLKVKIP